MCFVYRILLSMTIYYIYIYIFYLMAVSTVCTPTKTFERVDLSPNSKDTLCLQCGKHVKDLDKRRRLFSGHKKTNVCENIENRKSYL